MLVRGGPLPAQARSRQLGRTRPRLRGSRTAACLPERRPESSQPANAAITVPPARGLAPTR